MLANRLTLSTVRSIAFFSDWIGLASPPCLAEKYELVSRENEFLLSRSDEQNWKPVPAESVEFLLAAIAETLRPVEAPPLTWTDDAPRFRLKVYLVDGDIVVAESDSQVSRMVPWKFSVLSTGEQYSSHNINL